MYSIIGDGNTNMWHDCIYVHGLIVTQLLFWLHIYNNFKVVATCNYNATFEKLNMIDYICMYDIYKLSYKKPIFNSLVTIVQLIDFLMWQFIY